MRATTVNNRTPVFLAFVKSNLVQHNEYHINPSFPYHYLRSLFGIICGFLLRTPTSIKSEFKRNVIKR